MEPVKNKAMDYHTLKLTIKKKWFDMILSGEKTEEYREIKPYWFARLVFYYRTVFEYFTGYNWGDDLYRIDGVYYICLNKSKHIGFKSYDTITFKNGYSKKSRSIKVELLDIKIGKGKKEWGAEPGKEYFVLMLGKINDGLQRKD